MAVIGYVSERAALAQFAAGEPGLCTVWGPAGVGKTALVQAAVSGALFCSCGEEELVVALADRLGIGESASLREATHAAVTARGLPLVLDDVAPEALARWWTEGLGVPVIATGRQRPRPADAVIHLRGLDLDAAEALLRRYAPEAPAEALRQLAERLDGLPLALELAGARLAVLTPAQLLARLEGSFAALGPGGSGDRSLDAVAAEAWSRLETREQRVLSLVAALDPGVDLPLLERLEPSALDAVQGLVDRSLVARLEPCGGRARYRTVVGVRELAAAHAPAAATLRAALHERAIAELAAWSRDADAVARLHRDAPLYARLASRDEPALWVAAGRAWVDALPWREALARLDPILAETPCDALRGLRAEALRAGDRAEEAEATLAGLQGDGTLAWLGGERYALLLRARVALHAKRLEEAQRLAEAVGGGAGEAVLAATLLVRGAIEAARTRWERAVDQLEREGDEAWLSWSLGPMAALEEWAGHPLRSAQLQERAIAVADRRRQPLRRLRAEHARAYARLDAGFAEEALGAADRLEFVAEAHGQARGALEARLLRADALDDLCRFDHARALRRELVPVARTTQRSLVGLLRLTLDEPVADDERDSLTGWVLALADARTARRQGEDPTPYLAHPGLKQGVPGLLAALVGLERPEDIVERGLPEALRSVRVRGEVRRADARLDEGERLQRWSAALDPEGRALVAGAHGLRLPGGGTLDLSRKKLWQRLFDALWPTEAGCDHDQLIEAGWPGERILPGAAANRLHKTLSQLRAAGLAELLLRDGERYRLDPRVSRWKLPPAGAWTGDELRRLRAPRSRPDPSGLSPRREG